MHINRRCVLKTLSGTFFLIQLFSWNFALYVYREPRMRQLSMWKRLVPWFNPPSAKLQPSQPFFVVWNSPTFRCGRRYNLPMNLKKFGIAANEKELFHGDVINIFYEGRFGLYPKILKNGVSTNGGIPQLANFTAHYEWIKADLDWYIPNKTYDGLAVIDWEAWRPLFERNHGREKRRYALRALAVVQSQHPWWRGSHVYRKTQLEYDKYARKLMEGTQALCQKLRPNAKWGFYLFPSCYNHRAGQNYCTKSTLEQNDKLSWLFRESKALYPSLYLKTQRHPESQRLYVEGALRETYRVSRRHAPSDVMVIPYSRYTYASNGQFYSKSDLESSIGQAADSGAAGVVLWESTKNIQHKEDCRLTHKYLHTVLGPFVRDVLKFTQRCSEGLCSGHGRCVSKQWANYGLMSSRHHKTHHRRGKRQAQSASSDTLRDEDISTSSKGKRDSQHAGDAANVDSISEKSPTDDASLGKLSLLNSYSSNPNEAGITPTRTIDGDIQQFISSNNIFRNPGQMDSGSSFIKEELLPSQTLGSPSETNCHDASQSLLWSSFASHRTSVFDDTYGTTVSMVPESSSVSSGVTFTSTILVNGYQEISEVTSTSLHKAISSGAQLSAQLNSIEQKTPAMPTGTNSEDGDISIEPSLIIPSISSNTIVQSSEGTEYKMESHIDLFSEEFHSSSPTPMHFDPITNIGSTIKDSPSNVPTPFNTNNEGVYRQVSEQEWLSPTSHTSIMSDVSSVLKSDLQFEDRTAVSDIFPSSQYNAAISQDVSIGTSSGVSNSLLEQGGEVHSTTVKTSLGVDKKITPTPSRKPGHKRFKLSHKGFGRGKARRLRRRQRRRKRLKAKRNGGAGNDTFKKGKQIVQKPDVRLQFRNYVCRCYDGWTGEFCQHKVFPWK